MPQLEDGFDAIGFSQGGLFLRWYAQYCDGPPIKNLITVSAPMLMSVTCLCWVNGATLRLASA